MVATVEQQEQRSCARLDSAPHRTPPERVFHRFAIVDQTSVHRMYSNIALVVTQVCTAPSPLCNFSQPPLFTSGTLHAAFARSKLAEEAVMHWDPARLGAAGPRLERSHADSARLQRGGARIC